MSCGDAMYLFGGVDILENGERVPSNDLFRFEPTNEVETGRCLMFVTKVPAGEKLLSLKSVSQACFSS